MQILNPKHAQLCQNSSFGHVRAVGGRSGLSPAVTHTVVGRILASPNYVQKLFFLQRNLTFWVQMALLELTFTADALTSHGTSQKLR